MKEQVNKTKTTLEDRKGFIKTTIERGYVKDTVETGDGTEIYRVRFKGTLQPHVVDQLKRFFEIKELANVYDSDYVHLVLEYSK